MSKPHGDKSNENDGVNQDIERDSPRSNGMRRFAGTWTVEEHKQFEESIASLKEIDVEMWTANIVPL
jgi:hypothetical protein